MPGDLAQKLASLARLPRRELVTLWTELKGARPAFRARRDFLARCVAYHLQEQAQRQDATQEHIRGVQHKLAICRLQRAELSQSLR